MISGPGLAGASKNTVNIAQRAAHPLPWMIWILSVKHLAMPFAALGIAWLAGYPLAAVKMGVLFAALPTSASAYVLATRMGGDGPLVARLVTASTLIGICSLPFWVAWLGAR
jgi:predicted permease